MPAFGMHRTGHSRWLRGPRKSIRATIVLQMQRLRGCLAGWHCSALVRHAIISTSGDATGAQRDAGGSMSADQGREAASAGTPEPLYGGHATRRLTIRDLAAAKAPGEKWPMLTAYDALTAAVFDSAGIPVLLVGDSAAMVVYGHDSTIPVTVDDLIPLTQAVVRGTHRALVVADLPFGSYQASPAAALESATRFLKETGAQA